MRGFLLGTLPPGATIEITDGPCVLATLPDGTIKRFGIGVIDGHLASTVDVIPASVTVEITAGRV